jgi:hypothetical protein
VRRQAKNAALQRVRRLRAEAEGLLKWTTDVLDEA